MELTDEDLDLFSELNTLYLSNLGSIRKTAKPYWVEGMDTTFLSVNAYSVLGLDSSLYAQFIQELQSKHVFTGNVMLSYYGTVKFELKEMTEMKWNDFNEPYIHKLVFDNSILEKPNKYAIIDSVLTENANYVFIRFKQNGDKNSISPIGFCL